jgi:hypothetical protein
MEAVFGEVQRLLFGLFGMGRLECELEVRWASFPWMSV